jgi:glycosyl transferase family 25
VNRLVAYNVSVFHAGALLMDIPVFYINRDCDLDRRKHIESELTRLGLIATRVAGVEGRNVPDWLSPYYDLTLSPGEIGCSASHLICYAAIRDLNLGYGVILEDDANLSPDFIDTVTESVRIAPPHWDVIRLSCDNKWPVQILSNVTSKRSLIRYTKIPVGTAGIIVSAAGARMLLTPRRIKGAIDVEIRTPWDLGLNVYGVYPAPITTNDAIPSTIPIRSGARVTKKHASTTRRFLFNLKTIGAWTYFKIWILRLFSVPRSA